jgi:hypothetical protein
MFLTEAGQICLTFTPGDIIVLEWRRLQPIRCGVRQVRVERFQGLNEMGKMRALVRGGSAPDTALTD